MSEVQQHQENLTPDRVTSPLSSSGVSSAGDISESASSNTSTPARLEGQNIVTPQKSSISVIFTDWVSDKSSELNATSNAGDPFDCFKPTLGGNRSRYFQLHRGHRPGLGLDSTDPGFSKWGKAKKRKTPSYQDYLSNESLAKRLKITPEKPAAQIIYEINPNLEFNFTEVKDEGSKTAPTYTCSVKFPPNDDGVEYIGEGRSKKLAKNDAAEKALRSLGVAIPPKEETSPAIKITAKMNIPEHSPSSDHSTADLFRLPPTQIQQSGMDIDFASDDLVDVNFTTFNTLNTAPVLSQPMVDDLLLRRLCNIPKFEENVTLALHTMFPGSVEYECLGEDGPAHDRTFTVKVSFNNQEYLGHGGSKKKARADAAKKALLMLLGTDCYNALVNKSALKNSMPLSNSTNNMENTQLTKAKKKKKSKSKKTGDSAMDTVNQDEGNGSECMDEDDGDDDDDWGEYDLNFSDHVCNLVREKYEELIAKDSTYAPFKVLAGVVMTTSSPIIYNAEVISVTTGTKCIEGDCMSQDGLSVNDCHAEILATRCLRDYLFSQIELLENAKNDQERNQCILEINQTPGTDFKYALKPDIKFHLYISTSPCGDARIFSPKGLEIDDDEPEPAGLEDTHPNKLNRGVLRSKIEAGEGTIPAANLYNGPQTWDSIVSGNALYTMSCSDKVCRWNVLGAQGALLYNLIGLIHYSSITLGSLHHPVHFKRAMYGRLEGLNSRLEIPFCVKKPKLMMVSREEKRRVKKSPNHAVCWSVNWSTPEILAASKGRCEPGGVASRLTKRVAFTRFLKLYKNESGKRENYVDLTYHDAKHLSTDYQKAKAEFVSFFKDSKLGPWIGKPLEQDLFRIK